MPYYVVAMAFLEVGGKQSTNQVKLRIKELPQGEMVISVVGTTIPIVIKEDKLTIKISESTEGVGEVRIPSCGDNSTLGHMIEDNVHQITMGPPPQDSVVIDLCSDDGNINYCIEFHATPPETSGHLFHNLDYIEDLFLKD